MKNVDEFNRSDIYWKLTFSPCILNIIRKRLTSVDHRDILNRLFANLTKSRRLCFHSLNLNDLSCGLCGLCGNSRNDLCEFRGRLDNLNG